MDFKAEQTSKVDASVFWQVQVGIRDNRGVAHVERKRFLNPPAHPGLTLFAAGWAIAAQRARGQADGRAGSARRALQLEDPGP